MLVGIPDVKETPHELLPSLTNAFDIVVPSSKTETPVQNPRSPPHPTPRHS
jgi:hypothetical protein